ncbi:MAG TPA: hypothetical protein VEZ41_10940 [Allosphingosinicella sp.]|nr:hypothetical protein [Allosphingosinicella sp.]
MPVMIPIREIDWSFVIGFGLIGTLIVTHLILCFAKGRYFARGSSTWRDRQPIAFWIFMTMEVGLIVIVFGGLWLYLEGGGTLVDVRPVLPENLVTQFKEPKI